MSKTKKKPAKGKIQTGRPNTKTPKLNINDRLFISAYTDPHSPTFGNGTQSYLIAHPKSTTGSAAVKACVALSNGKIANEVEQVIKELDLGVKVRAKAIKEIITGNYRQETTTVSTDKEGNTYESTAKRTPSAREVVQAVDLINKLDGTYDKNRVRADVMSAEMKSIIREQKRAYSGNTGTGGGGKGPAHGS